MNLYKLGVLFLQLLLICFAVSLTAQNFYQVKDIYPGELSSGISGFSVMQNKAYFWATNESNSKQLWVSNGQEEGTFQISNIPITAWPNIPVVISDSLLIFTSSTDNSGLELFYSNGALGSEDLLVDLNPGSGGSISQFGRGDGIYVYFMGGNQLGEGFYRTDGTAEGTILLLDDTDGLSSMMRYNGNNFTRIFMSGETWLLKTDGTDEGTKIITKIQSQQVSIPNVGIVAFKDSLYFLKEHTDGSWGLWRTDGTIDGLIQVTPLNPAGVGSPNSLVATDNQLFFNANDGVNGREIWISDGTAAGTNILVDLEPPSSTSAAGSSLTTFKDGILFKRDDGIHGYELWISDGTVVGTHLLKDIWPGSASSEVDLKHSLIIDSIIYFAASTLEYGNELWQTNGTESGTFMIADICQGTCNGYPNSFSPIDDSRFVFEATTPESGFELWVFEHQTPTGSSPDFGETSNVLIIYPNPAYQENIHLVWPNHLKPYKLQLMDMTGKIILDIDINMATSPLNIRIPDISSGIYSIYLSGKSGQIIASTKLSIR